MTIAARLKTFRIRNNKSLKDVADAVKTSKAHIWDLETGKSKNPSLDLLVRLADYMKISVSDLVGEKPDIKSDTPELIALFRQLKKLESSDLKIIEGLAKDLKNRNPS